MTLAPPRRGIDIDMGFETHIESYIDVDIDIGIGHDPGPPSTWY